MNENKHKPTIRQTRKSGGSIILTLTDFAEDGDVFTLKKEGNNIILTSVKVEE